MYEVSYSGHVIDELRAMIDRNPAHEQAILDAHAEIHRRLRIYPQFGDPLRNLSAPNAQPWIATVGPLVVHYILVEPDDPTRRFVTIVRPFIPATGSGIV
jgi:hypothetical protein